MENIEITTEYIKLQDLLKLAAAVQTACEDIPKSFVVCDHPYHRQIIYISQLNSQTLQKRAQGKGE